MGPKLEGVVGRAAGSVAGYPYSPALAHAGLTWTAVTLDKWLAGPRAFVPGAEMPFSLPDAARRRDIIAYLETLQPTPGRADGPPATPTEHSEATQPAAAPHSGG